MNDFATKTEIPAQKFTGGRFIDYSSSISFERWWTHSITRGDITTNIEDLDPMQSNGRGTYIFVLGAAVGLILCGYGQACADTQAKEAQKRFEQEIDQAKEEIEAEKYEVREHRDRIETIASEIGATSF